MNIKDDLSRIWWDPPLRSLFEDGVVRLHRVESEQEVDVRGVVVPPRSLTKQNTSTNTELSVKSILL